MAFSDVPFQSSSDDIIKSFVRTAVPRNTEPLPSRSANNETTPDSTQALENAMRVSAVANRTRNQYLQSQVETASPTRLVVMLYEGAIRFSKQGVEAMNAQRFEDKNYYLVKAQRIIAELLGSLNREAGDVTSNLMRLYMYMLERLVDANVKDDPKPLQEVIGMLEELRESWIEIDKIAAQSAGTAGVDIRSAPRLNP